MMKSFVKIFLWSTLLMITSCEVEEIVSPEEVYIEYTVVQAEIQADQFFPGVRFTKTLPLGIPYDIKKAELKDVTAYIVKNQIQVIPLVYNADGLYKPKYGFIVQAGDVYELFAETSGKFISAKTIVPYLPQVSSIRYIISDYHIEADVISRANEVYGAIWIISQIPPITANDFYSITGTSYLPGTEITVQTSAIPEEYLTNLYSGKRYLQVFSFEESFKKYFNSRTAGQEITDPFIQGGGAVEWNVKGDKVIGMFIGVTPGNIIRVN